MQKKLLTLAVTGALAAPAAALAQVEVYGTIHMSFNHEKFGDSPTGVPSVSKFDVASHASNIGVRARENLGGGLSAWAQVETNDAVQRRSDELRSVVGQMQGSVEIQTRGSQRIGENVEAVQSAVRGITEGLKQQGEASQGVALVVRRSMDYTRSHESTAAEISRAAETLARQAEALRESVRRFRI